jgi:hypothetical protein
MENWKVGVIAGTVGTGLILLLNGKKTAGIVLAGVGAAVLASEYPDQLEEFRDRLPRYAEQGMRILDNVSRAGERFAELLEKRGRAALEELSF